MNRFSPRLLWILATIAAAMIAIYFRLYPLTVYQEYSAKNTAKFLTYSAIRKSIEKNILTKYPQMPPEKILELKNESFKKFLVEQKDEIESLVETNAQTILSDKNAPGKSAFLMEVDPYYYLSLTRGLLDKNSPPRQTKGRNYFDEMMLAPSGAWYPMDYHPYVGLAIYRLTQIIVPDIPLDAAVALLPLFLSVLCVLPFLFICSRILSLDVFSSFLGAVYLILSPIFLRRSLWGWFDTDSYNILFPLLILMGLFLFLQEVQSKKRKLLWLSVSALTAAAYSLFWQGWLLQHALISAALLLLLLTAGFGRPLRERLMDFQWAGLLYVSVPIFLTPLFWGWEGLSNLLSEASDLVKSFYLPSFSLWPDVFITVGELRNSSWLTLLQSLGGVVIFILIGAGILPVLRKKSNHSPAIKKCVFFTALMLLLTAPLGADIERFALLAVVPAALGVALGVRQIASWLNRLKKYSAFSFTALFYTLALAYIFWQGHMTARFEHSIYNSTWDRAMTYFREKTPPDSIVTSWWSPGHFIRCMGQRRVTFDGATQNTPQAYWVGNLFLDKSEDKAASILRMMNLSGNQATEFLTDVKKLKLSDAIALIHHILPLDRNNAAEELNGLLNTQDSVKLLNLTHGTQQAPGSYVFVFNNMVEQVMALEYTGKWNFAKAEKFSESLKRKPSGVPRALLSRSSKERVRLLWSMAQGPYLQDEESFAENVSGRTAYFNNGLTLNLDTLEAVLSSRKFGSGRPKNVYFMKNGQLEKKALFAPDLNLSVLLIQDEPINANGEKKLSYRSVLADERLIESLIFRLYYLRGEGLKKFKLVVSEESVFDRTRLCAYEVILDSR